VAVAFATAGAGAATTSASVSVPYPTGISSGDTLVLHVLTRAGTAIATPSGWTLITSGVPGDGIGLHAAFLTTAAGTESGSVSVTTTDSGVAGVYGRMYRFTGATGSEGAGQENGSSATVSDRTVTTSGADRLAVNLVAIEDNVAVAAFTGMTGGTWAEAVSEYITTIGNDATLQLQTAQIASAGTINGGTQTIAASASYNVIGFALIAGFEPITSTAAALATASGTAPVISLVDVENVFPPSARATASGPTPADFPQEDIDFYVAIDFGDGYHQLDDLMRSATIRRGRSSNLERVEAGTGGVVFKNGDGHLDPANTTGDHYGLIRPLVPIRIMRRQDGVTYERLIGPVERWLPQWVIPTETRGYSEMAVEFADNFEALANITLVSDVATLETALSGANNDLVFTAREAGARGDEISVEYVVAGTDTSLDAETNDPIDGRAMILLPFGGYASVSGFSAAYLNSLSNPQQPTTTTPVVFTVQGTDITITVATNSFGDETTTAAQIKALIESTPELDALVSVAHASGSSGAGIVNAMARTNLSGGKWPEELSGARINRILDLAGWPADQREIDAGDYQIVSSGFSIRDNVSAIQHIQDVADSELGYVFMRGDNTFVYHDASHRNVDPRSTSSNATFSNTGTGFVFQELQMSLDKDAIINEATVTSGTTGAVPQTATDAASQAIYGVRSVSRSTLLANDADCLSQATAIVEAFAEPLQRVESLTTMETGLEDGWTPAILGLDIGDRITLVATPPVEAEEYETTTSYELFVEAITDTYTPGQPVTIQLVTSAAEQSVAAPPPDSDLFVLNNLGGILIVGDPVNGIIAGDTPPSYTAEPASAISFASGPTPTLSGGVTVTVPAAALASAAGGTFTADLIIEPEPAAATATGPTPPTVGGSITVTVPAAAAATAAAGLTTVSIEIGPTAAAATGASSAATVNIT
jgi:hypothetical protein